LGEFEGGNNVSDAPKNQHFNRLNALVDDGHVGRLTHAQLRVWIVLERYADVENGKTYPSHGTIAEKVGMSIRSVQRAIDDLIAGGLLEKIHRSSPGKVPEYRVVMPPKTHDTHDTQGVACSHDTHDTQGVACSHDTHDTQGVACSTDDKNEHTTKNGVTGDKNGHNTRHPHVASNGRTEERYIERENISLIYSAYPRKLGKAAASKAIIKALAEIAHRLDGPEDPVEWLLERVRRFADSPAGKKGKYTPHPATWFNAGRFDDDPNEWLDRPVNGEHLSAASAKAAREYDESDLPLPSAIAGEIVDPTPDQLRGCFPERYAGKSDEEIIEMGKKATAEMRERKAAQRGEQQR
jgi:hypothetical protein